MEITLLLDVCRNRPQNARPNAMFLVKRDVW